MEADINQRHVLYYRSHSITVRAIWDSIRVNLAGIAGESVSVAGMWPSSATDDLTKALEYARSLSQARHAEEVSSLLERHAGTEFSLDISRVFVKPPTARETHILNTCYHEARVMLDTHEWAFRAIEKRLLEKRRIERAELESLLGPRPWA